MTIARLELTLLVNHPMNALQANPVPWLRYKDYYSGAGFYTKTFNVPANW
ncbi:unnamed protein product, partial [marine sediment metagenome]